MSLTIRDAGTTVLTAGTVLLATGTVRGRGTFFSNRWAIVGMMVLGIGTCTVGSHSAANTPALYATLMVVIIGIATIAATLGLSSIRRATS